MLSLFSKKAGETFRHRSVRICLKTWQGSYVSPGLESIVGMLILKPWPKSIGTLPPRGVTRAALRESSMPCALKSKLLRSASAAQFRAGDLFLVQHRHGGGRGSGEAEGEQRQGGKLGHVSFLLLARPA